MKNNKIQMVRTSGLLGILILGGITSLMIFTPWARDTKDLEVLRAQQKAEVIAYQIVEIYKVAKLENSSESAPIQSRGLASVQSSVVAGGILKEFKNQGNMGIDPWGHPYQYKIITKGNASQLMVWSLGPNGNLDNQAFMNDSTDALSAPIQGDDIRVQLPLPEAASN